MKISVLGLGYVGLPLAAAIAKLTNHNVLGYDIDSSKVESIKQGISPIDDEQCAKDLKEITLNVSDESSSLGGTDIFIVCVPTPVLDDYMPDLTPVIGAVTEVCNHLQKGNVIIVESTINPGVCDEVLIPLVEEKTGMKAGVDFDLAHCPERINPGDTKWNVYNIPRNIGSTSAEATKKTADLYREFIDAEINEMPSLKTAEATKIIENTFRDINIAFVNELAKSFDVLDIDLKTVIDAAANKPFAFMPHYPSCGVGGHCIPVDPYYLIERAKQSGFDHKFLKLAREINNSMPTYTIGLLADGLNEFAKSIKGTKVALLGLSYKANVGDLRQSPSLVMQKELEEKGADLIIFDPHFPDRSNVASLDEALEKATAVIIATDHTEFKTLTPELLQAKSVNVVIDGKNCLDKTAFANSGIAYKGIGR
jgi:nucleotide sugar dehydrogenase